MYRKELGVNEKLQPLQNEKIRYYFNAETYTHDHVKDSTEPGDIDVTPRMKLMQK